MTIGSRSSGEGLHRVRRWLIPSIGDLIFIALLGLLAFTNLSVRLLGDGGIGWHIRTGQLILANHAIPRVDPFSSSMAGQPWFAWEWLYDVLAGWLDGVAGLNGVVFFSALVIALTFSFAYHFLLRRGVNFFVALDLVLLAASAAMIHFFARPHVVSWLFTVLWFAILESSDEKCCGRKRFEIKSRILERLPWSLWWLPPLMLVWVNVHGGFLLGFVLLGIYWLGAVWRWFQLKEDRLEDALEKICREKQARQFAGVGLISALATLANPYGWRLHLHIYRYLSDRFLMDHIDEFQSPNFHGVAQKCFAVLILLALAGLAIRKRAGGERGPGGIKPSAALVLLFAVYSGLYASRNIPLSALLMVIVIAPWFSDAMRNFLESAAHRRSALSSQSSPKSFLWRMQRVELSLRGQLWSVAAVLLTCWITFHGGRLGSRTFMDAHFDAKRFPVGAVSYLDTRNVEGSVFTPDSWGGYVIYRLYPRVKVAIDDRHDFYGEPFLRSYLRTMHVEPGWQGFLKEYPVAYAVVPQDSALANIMAETADWQRIYGDNVAVVYARTAPTTQ